MKKFIVVVDVDTDACHSSGAQLILADNPAAAKRKAVDSALFLFLDSISCYKVKSCVEVS